MIVTASVYEYGADSLPGANVFEVGTNNGVSTNENGQFAIDVAGSDSQLKVSYIGYDWDTFRAGDINGKRIYLYPNNEELEEVTVTNNYKKPDYTLWYILAAVAAVGITYQLTKPKPKTVKV